MTLYEAACCCIRVSIDCCLHRGAVSANKQNINTGNHKSQRSTAFSLFSISLHHHLLSLQFDPTSLSCYRRNLLKNVFLCVMVCVVCRHHYTSPCDHSDHTSGFYGCGKNKEKVGEVWRSGISWDEWVRSPS